jgi:hydroxypyruvate isomerase
MQNIQPLRANINQSVCRWCFNELSIEDLCKLANEIGLVGIDLLGPSDWPVLEKSGLKSTMCNGAEISLEKGWNNKVYHSELLNNYREMIPLVAKAGHKNLICFSGNRDGLDDATGLQNCAEGLKQIMSLAERNKVTIVMELLNSKIDHIDYQCDRTNWGVELVKKVGSDNFKLLYDIYHMQIDEGDVIRTIKDNYHYIAHYHTAGVPGRHEIDDSQELNYPAIMRAILDTGFKGYVAQEFIPLNTDKAWSLKDAVRICDV